MSKISYDDFCQKLSSVGISDVTVRHYLKVDPYRSGAFNPRFIIDPAKVDISDDDLESASAVCFDCWSIRKFRHTCFKRAIANGDTRVVLVSEGDSWFQHPYLCDVVDHLGKDYLIWSLGAVGDTVADMTGKNAEYMDGLYRWSDQVKGFLFSAGGNDLFDKNTSGQSKLLGLLKKYQSNQSAAWHIEHVKLKKMIDLLSTSYSGMIATIRNNKQFATLPIFIHGYDYPFPYQSGTDDDRDFCGRWLCKPFASRGYPNSPFRRDVLKVVIDALYCLMHELASTHDHVHVVDVRNSMPNRDLWNDEIHGTDDGFAKVAARFRASLAPIISQPKGAGDARE